MPISGNTITIRNVLEVRPDNTILIPGNEPISSLTSNTLAANMINKGSVIGLAEALILMPGSRVEHIYNGGGALGTIRRVLVMPDGPPPSPGNCNTAKPGEDPIPICRKDWYQILRDNAKMTGQLESEKPPTVDGICNFFSLKNRSDIL